MPVALTAKTGPLDSGLISIMPLLLEKKTLKANFSIRNQERKSIGC
jgi:hypothetical protein